MGRYKTDHGVTVNVDDELAARIGARWKPVGADEQPEGDPDASWTLPQLKTYASEHGIDLGGAKTKPKILAAITESDSSDEGSDDEGNDEDDESSDE